MKSNIKKIFFIFIVALSACNYSKNVRLLIQGEPPQQSFLQEIPFTYKKDLIVVKARVNNDTTERDFIFDTGAFNSKIEYGLAEQIGLEIKATKSNSTAQGVTQEIEVTQIDSLCLGETCFYNISAGKLKYAPKSASPCIASAGIIGANLIKLAHWQIDYKNRLIRFSDQPFKSNLKKSYKIPFDKPLLSGTPSIDLIVDGKKIEGVLFDVGYNGGLILPRKFSTHFSGKSKITLDQSTSGIYGTNIDTLITKDLTLNLGGFKTGIPIEFSSLDKALIGNDFLEHFIVNLNYDDKTITLQPQSPVKITPPLDFIPGILDDSLWVVNRITLPSQFQLGDTLSKINGKRPSELFDSYCDYIINVGDLLKSDSLVIERY